MKHLMANSGIQFITHEVEFSPDQPLMLPSGRSLKTIMCERFDPFAEKRTVDFVVQTNDGSYLQLSSLDNNGFQSPLKTAPDGSVILDEAGLPMIHPDFDADYLPKVMEDDFTKVHIIPTLNSYRVPKEFNRPERVPAFDRILDRWLPIPLFQNMINGYTGTTPTGWCRVKISEIEKGKNANRYRIIYAVDTTTTGDTLSMLQPWFHTNSQGEQTEPYKDFSISNVSANLLDFYFTKTTSLSGEEISQPSAEANYFSQLLGIEHGEDESMSEDKFKPLAFYSYIIMFLRHTSPLNIRLFNDNLHGTEPIDIDLVLDIGNSKTCGILFESGDFKRRQMLKLRDMSRPWVEYGESFDMRIVFRQTDFGDGIGIPDGEHLFKWRSLLRIGNEAINLMHTSIEDEGMSKKCNNYSSPKRYIWDTDKYDGRWEFLHAKDDPLSLRNVNTIYMDRLTPFIKEDGSISDTPEFMQKEGCHYSRSSLMTLAFLEIFRQAESQINSTEFRETMGEIDRPRRLRNVIITAPTAMPNAEQVRLRRMALDAFTLMNHDGVKRAEIKVYPAPEDIISKPAYAMGRRDWCYDEATACQLVYIYAEIQERYGGEARRFIDLKGSPREDMENKGYPGNVLTIGSVDIGAGTTDLMICSYGINGIGHVTPVPLFWDSFYLAGDDILRSIVQNLILDGGDRGDMKAGTISSVLNTRLQKFTDDEFSRILDKPIPDDQKIDIRNILRAPSEERRAEAIEAYAKDLMFDYFGGDSACNTYRDRRCRVDFNSQISVPLATYFLQMYSEHRPQRDVTFHDVFGKYPPASYLLEHFRNYFGFSFEEIIWEYRPEKLADEVRKIMTPLVEQLSVLLHAYKVDIVMLAGRPTSLGALTDLFLKSNSYPVSPDRLIRLPAYEVGNWYPFSHGTGEITDQKTIVAVGAYIGYLASHGGIKGFNLDMGHLAREMGATADYIGKYLARTHRVSPTLLTPQTSTVNLKVDSFPYIFGCKRLDTPVYESRPLYVLEWIGDGPDPMDTTVLISRQYQDNKEKLQIEDAFDSQGGSYKSKLRLREQSLVDSESGSGISWLDDGAFKYLKK